jgi:hypothetical protein
MIILSEEDEEEGTEFAKFYKFDIYGDDELQLFRSAPDVYCVH